LLCLDQDTKTLTPSLEVKGKGSIRVSPNSERIGHQGTKLGVNSKDARVRMYTTGMATHVITSVLT
jgi:hypothetical protein